MLPVSLRDEIAWTVRSTVLRPFLDMQESVVRSRAEADELAVLRRTTDSLAALVVAGSRLEEENRSLRALLGIGRHPAARLIGVTLLRPGPSGSESTFMVNRGSEAGLASGSPVVTPAGLLGRIVGARRGMAVGIDWTHRDFRASAMLADGSAYGIVYTERGAFREEDRLVLDGLPYHGEPVEGRLVVTSGLGSVYPRGVPIGTIASLREERIPWAKTYWLVPAVKPASVRHAAVGVPDPGSDYGTLWSDDTLQASAPPTAEIR